MSDGMVLDLLAISISDTRSVFAAQLNYGLRLVFRYFFSFGLSAGLDALANCRMS